MVRGIYTAASGLLTAERDINVRSNNIANLNTAGFKQDRIVNTTFADALAVRQETRTTGVTYNIGDVSRGKKALDIKTDFSQGALQATDRSLDFAISGDGFFTVQSYKGEYDPDTNPNGIYNGKYYTRNGQFQINPDGDLINGLGDLVLDNHDQPIPVERYDFTVDQSGNIYSADGNFIATLGIYNPDDPNLLVKSDEEAFTVLNADNEPVPQDFTGTIRQGYVEKANTDLASQMAGLIASSRSFQSMTQIIKAIDAEVGKSISDVARV
ncbi:MAG: flagellar hook-basal body protein [Oscillospiraceae bacterium]|nr:flagellar hook-basal body protein [Oscillospiraceae bacterium]